MQKPDMHKLAAILRSKKAEGGGTLPELYGIAWHSYLHDIGYDVIDHTDYEIVQDFFPSNEDDPDDQNPVLAIAHGKHRNQKLAESDDDCVLETTFEGLSRQIKEEAQFFAGQLPSPYAVAYEAKLLALYHNNEISDNEYQQLLAMLPVTEDSPVAEVEEFMRECLTSNDASMS